VSTPFDEIRVPAPRTRPSVIGHLPDQVERGAFEDVTLPAIGSRAGVAHQIRGGRAPSVGAPSSVGQPSLRPPPPAGQPLPPPPLPPSPTSAPFHPPGGRRRQASRRPPTTPGWVFSVGIFAVLSLGLTFLVARVLAPWIIGNASVSDLGSVADRVAASYFAVTVLSAALAAVVGSWQSGRTGRSWLIRTFHGLIGPMVAIGVLVLVAWFTHQPIPSGPTEANATLAFAAALLAAGVTASVHGGGPALLAGTTRLPKGRLEAGYPIVGVPHLSVMALALLPVLAPVNQSGMLSNGSPRPQASSASFLESGNGSGSVLLDGAADPGPEPRGDIDPSDCALQVTAFTQSADLTLFSVDLGAQYAFSETQLPGNQWTATVSDGLKVGFKLSEGGDGVIGSDLKQLGIGISVSTDPHATLTESNTYFAESKAQADALVRWGFGRYSAEELALPGFDQLVTQSLDSQPAVRDVPPPQTTQLTLDGALDLEADFGEAANYSASLSFGGSAEITLESTDRTNTDPSFVDNPDNVELALGLEGDGSATASNPIVGSLTGGAQAEAEASLAFKRVGAGLWVPDDAGLNVTLGVNGSYNIDALGSALSSIGAKDAPNVVDDAGSTHSKVTASGGGGDSVGVSADIAASVSLADHPEVVTTFLQLVKAAQKASAPHATQAERDAYDALANRLGHLLARYGVVSIQAFVVDSGSLDFSIAYGDGITFGAGAGVEGTQQTLLGAWYGAEGSFAASNTCVPSGSA
jgi:hypothetical protein